MTKIQVQILLDDIHAELFLNKIIMIRENEKAYKASDYYKETRVPLMELYKNYAQYTETTYAASERIEELIKNLDTKVLVDKVTETITALETDPEGSKILSKITEFFNIENLSEKTEELDKAIQGLKK